MAWALNNTKALAQETEKVCFTTLWSQVYGVPSEKLESEAWHRLVPSRYLSVFWGERRLEIRLRRARGLMGREEGQIRRAGGLMGREERIFFSFFPSHEAARAPPPNSQSSHPKKHLKSDWVRVWARHRVQGEKT